MTKAPKKFLLLYGSQTGQAQSICEEIAETASKHGLEAELYCLSQTDKKVRLWVSQTQSICEEIAETASKHGLEAELHCLSQTDKKVRLWVSQTRSIYVRKLLRRLPSMS